MPPDATPIRDSRPRFAQHAKKFARAVLLLAGIGAGLWGGVTWMHFSQVEAARSACQKWESERNWSKLLVAAHEWRRLEPTRRDAMQAGATASRELRQPNSVFEFLKDHPAETKGDAPWLSMLASAQMGPLKDPLTGLSTLQKVLTLDPKETEVRRRIIFFHAVMVQPVELLAVVRDSAENEADLPEFYAYAFLADGLKLSNALERIKRWMRGDRDEPMMVAYALNSARNLDGGVPPMDEAEATKLRHSQALRASYLQQLREMFPENHHVLAYDLGQAVSNGQTVMCAELLSRATAVADGDYRFWRARGWLFLKAGDFVEAQRAFDEALKLHPIDWRTRYYLADLNRRNRRLDVADQEYQLAAEGKELESAFLAASDVQHIPHELFDRLRVFAGKCGDELVAQRLEVLLSTSKTGRASPSVVPNRRRQAASQQLQTLKREFP
ncbi:tetratricopeptide repeat protein [Schlesneria sp.]|uniref:tetratricopeptide repeat protein n=1 Tax=Schlesneria sp. TaxID=2762018 RepID=UPI002F216D5C